MFHSTRSAPLWIGVVLAFGLAGGCAPGGAGGGGGGGGDADANANANANGNVVDNQNDNQATTNGLSDALVTDHAAAADFEAIPDSFLAEASAGYRIFYGHTSHGSQIVTGMNMIQAEDDRCAFNAGEGSLYLHERDDVDLGYEGDLAWVDVTREVLDTWDVRINMVMWSWCAGVSDNTEEGIDAYLEAMNELESEYPGVVFVYMTGHLDGTGADGTLNVLNDRIRDYCRANDRILFDFADIESYDPDGDRHPNDTEACEWCEDWCAVHSCPTCDECAHSHCFNCYQKGRAFWWMMARIAGWDGG